MSEPRRTSSPAGHFSIEPGRTRKSASGPGARRSNAADVAIYFREDCRSLRDALQLEMVVAQYCLRMRDVRTPEGVAVGRAVALAVVAELEGHGDELSHAILRGLAHLATGETAARSAKAAERLAANGVGVPPEFSAVGKAEPIGAWRTCEGGHPGEYVLFAEFEHPRGPRHTIALFVQPRGAGTVKHLALLGPMDSNELEGPFHPDAMESLEIPAAGELMRELLARTYGPPAAGTDEFRVLIAEARAQATCGVQA